MARVDYDKIFIKDACPTKIGGQAVMEGVMMQGPDRVALAMRMPSGELYLKTKKKERDSEAMKIPFVRGVVAFWRSLVNGMGTLMESADLLEESSGEEAEEETESESESEDETESETPPIVDGEPPEESETETETKESETEKPSNVTPDKPGPNGPKTGDDSNIALWMLMMAASAACVAFMVYEKKRERADN